MFYQVLIVTNKIQKIMDAIENPVMSRKKLKTLKYV